MKLPEEFVAYTRRMMGEKNFQKYLDSFDDSLPVSIRLNKSKTTDEECQYLGYESKVPWSDCGYFLKERPNFTFDPLLHAGCYYVQEASSMFVEEALRQIIPTLGKIENALDLCAAPGGKSLILRSMLPQETTLYCNEPVRTRANILYENVCKTGAKNTVVTNNYPADYASQQVEFDLILADVPCSGEGMFRKDEGAIKEWSVQNVEKCAKLQREIVSTIWDRLKVGGLMIYSTCTFNLHEDEENVKWICENLGGKAIPLNIKPDWDGITGSLLEGFDEPVYHFIPGMTRGEGFFLAVVEKKESISSSPLKGREKYQSLKVMTPELLDKAACVVEALQNSPLNFPLSGETCGKTIPLNYDDAIKYLRREALTLGSDVPTGFVTVCYKGHALGMVKNIGKRANNLYPQAWAIKTTHIPEKVY